MKGLPFIVFIVLLLPLRAQQDTTVASTCSGIWAPAAGTTLLAGGALLTFTPEMKSWAVDLRDAVQADGHSKLHFDDYLEYVMPATPVALNLCGLKSRHEFKKLALLEGGSYLLGVALLEAGKFGFGVPRPDNNAPTSFPSGHTFSATAAAEILRREYGEEYPWMAVAGYTVATLVGAMRIYNNRHWVGDVLAGAGLGILSVSAVYWLFD
ncbi:MAG: phosphatase PAP2 family protein [Bacteroidales bacterium]|nr:phosphatase PAP2 family protein [Bacteroidales bacterium]